MNRALAALTMAFAAAHAHAGVGGFVQLRDVERTRGRADCAAVEACRAMSREGLAELLVESRLHDRTSTTVRAEAWSDDGIGTSGARVREAFVETAFADAATLKLGRQVLSWGVSDYVFVNDLFPKNYDAFFTGAGFDRLKEPVDAARLAVSTAGVDVEAVMAKARSDTAPDARRFAALAGTRDALGVDDEGNGTPDAMVRVSGHVGTWDAAAYVGRLRSREVRFFVDGSRLQRERPLTSHAGFSVTGNAVGGVAWLEGAVRHVASTRAWVVSRYAVGSNVKAIAGYSRELASDVQVTAQWQIETATAYGRYVAALAPGIRPVHRTQSILHLRAQGRWRNQTVTAGMQAFVSDEGDAHVNPFAIWSPADGWTIEGGANLFSGKPDTRYGAFRGDSNAYLTARYSF